MSQRFVVITQFRDLPQAGLAQSTLEANGIQCFVDNQFTIGVNWLYSTALGGVKLKVLEEDVERARAVLKQLETFEPPPEVDAVGERAVCPKCGSANITTLNYTRKAAAISLLLSLPFLFFLKRNRCLECRHKWK